MIFVNIGDGYSSGCCTGSRYFTAEDDPELYQAPFVEHPLSRPGSFVNQLAEVYKAKPITIARHRTTIEEIFDTIDNTKEIIHMNGEQKIVFFGIPSLYSDLVDEEYLLLDGHDETIIPEDVYRTLCESALVQDLTDKIAQLNHYILEISNIVDKVILYRTTSDPVELDIPHNVINTDLNIVEKLRENYKPYKRGYFDTRAYSSLKKEFLKLLWHSSISLA